MKNTEKKAKNTDWILKQLLEEIKKKSETETKKKKEEDNRCWKFGKISALRILLFFYTEVEFREQNLPFEATLSNITIIYFLDPTVKLWKNLNIFTLHSLYINTETTITVRNISKKLEKNKGIGFTTEKSQKTRNWNVTMKLFLCLI